MTTSEAGEKREQKQGVGRSKVLHPAPLRVVERDSALDQALALATELESRLVDLVSVVESDYTAYRPRAVARELNRIILSLVRHEIKVCGLKDGIDAFCRHLCAEAPLSELFSRCGDWVARRMYGNPATERAEADGLDSTVYALHEVLEWYLRRKKSVIALAALDSSLGDNVLFDLAIAHDRQLYGVDCMEITTGLQLAGYRGQQLWFKAFVSREGVPVGVRKDWQLWIDETELLFSVGDQNRDRVAFIMPVLPDRQRVIIDKLRACIPYAALDLPPGQSELMIKLAVCAQNGETLASDQRTDRISVPALEESGNAVPAPQALGIWEQDPVCGDSLSHFKVDLVPGDSTAASKSTSEQNLPEQSALKVEFDFVACGHKDQLVSVECRLLQSTGELVATSVSECRDEQGYFLSTSELRPIHEIQRFFGQELILPMAALELANGTQQLLCELTILNGSGRVLCGSLQGICIDVGSGAETAASAQGELRVSEQNAVYGESEHAPSGESFPAVTASSGTVYSPREAIETPGFGIALLQVGVEQELVQVDYEFEVSTHLEQEYLLCVDFLDESNHIVLDRSAGNVTMPVSEDFYAPLKGKLSFRRNVPYKPARDDSLRGSLVLGKNRFFMRAGERNLLLDLSVIDAFGEEVAAAQVSFTAYIPQSVTRGVGRLVEWFKEQ